MKKIINKRTGNSLTLNEAFRICFDLKYRHNIKLVEYKSKIEYGYETSKMAETSEIEKITESYEEYIFAFIKPRCYGMEGYKVYFLAVTDLPGNFEEIYPNYEIVGE